MKVYTSWKKTSEKLSFEAHISTWMRTWYRSLDLNRPQMHSVEAKKVHDCMSILLCMHILCINICLHHVLMCWFNYCTEIVSGVEVCGETVFEVVSDRLPQKLVWPGYGLNIEVPQGALPPGVTASMAIRAITKGKFKLPENTQLIGALYWIYCSEIFLEHIAVNIQHCAIISTEETCESFAFIIAKCSQEDLPYKCIERKGVFRSDTQYATIKLKRFSIIGPVGPAGGKKSYVALKFYKQVLHSFDVRFCFIVASNCEPHIKVCTHDRHALSAISAHKAYCGMHC